jgi:hypothetical protein
VEILFGLTLESRINFPDSFISEGAERRDNILILTIEGNKIVVVVR